MTRLRSRRLPSRSLATFSLGLLAAFGCGGSSSGGGTDTTFSVDTTRLCALVPAIDPAAAAFPPTPPVEVFGTDLGWTYEVNGRIPILFGDTWQRIDICPIQTNDDSLGTLHLPASNWAGYDSSGSIPESQCLDITYEIDEAGTSFAPITLHRWDGTLVPLGPLNTPVTGFYDGVREWGVFIVAGGQACTPAQSESGATCPSELSPQAADLVCGVAGGRTQCVDPTSTRKNAGAEALYLHVAERVGPSAYITRAMFLTNKYFNFTARTVRSFDPSHAGGRDYEPGQSVLLAWGRPGFDDISGDGESPPYFLYHPLPLEVVDGRTAFAPRYFTGVSGGAPAFGTDQADAVPLYTGELEPVNHAAISWISPLERWLMIYSGSSTDFIDPERRSGRTQPVRGAMYARMAAEPWGPWTEPEPVLTNEQAAPEIACGHQAPVGCVPPQDPLIRPQCLEDVDPGGGGNLYGANIIDQMTRVHPATSRRGAAADVFWNYSTWHPYSVVLARTRVEVQ